MRKRIIFLVLLTLVGLGLYIWNDSAHEAINKVFQSQEAGWTAAAILFVVAMLMKKK